MSQNQDHLCSGILMAGSLAAVILATSMSLGVLTESGAVFSAIMCLIFWLIGTVILIRWPLFRNHNHTICALTGLYLCICLRLSLFAYISPDYVSFLSNWTATMRTMSVRDVLTTPIGDYNMPYLYLLLLISRLPFYDLYCIKLVSVLADVFVALAIGKLTALYTKQSRKILLAFFASLLIPTGFLNSAYWGQCDGVYAAFALWGLYCGLRRQPIRSMALFALAFAFKLQTIFLLPIVVFFLGTELVRPKEFLAFPITFFAVMLPALLAGRSFSDTFSIYLNQTNAYPYMSLNAPSFWSIIPDDYYQNFASASVLLAGIVVLILLYLFLRRHTVLTQRDFLELSLIFTLAIPWLLPKMHERYFYLAEMISLVYAAVYPRRTPVALAVCFGGFLAYSNYLFGNNTIFTIKQTAVVYGVILCYITLKLYRSVYRRTVPTTQILEGGDQNDKA